MSWLDAYFAAFRIDDARAVWSHKTRPRLTFQCRHNLQTNPVTSHLKIPETHTYLVRFRNPFSNADYKPYFTFYSFDDGVRSVRGRDIKHGCIWLSLPNGLMEPVRVRTMQFCRHAIPQLTSLTEPNTGRPRCVCPAFFGETPPTIFVPYASASLIWKVAWRCRLDKTEHHMQTAPANAYSLFYR